MRVALAGSGGGARPLYASSMTMMSTVSTYGYTSDAAMLIAVTCSCRLFGCNSDCDLY